LFPVPALIYFTFTGLVLQEEYTFEKRGTNPSRRRQVNFDDKIEVAKAYDEAARKYRGEFAVLNFGKPSVFAKSFNATGREHRETEGVEL
jgi:hypothetical protein